MPTQIASRKASALDLAAYTDSSNSLLDRPLVGTHLISDPIEDARRGWSNPPMQFGGSSVHL